MSHWYHRPERHERFGDLTLAWDPDLEARVLDGPTGADVAAEIELGGDRVRELVRRGHVQEALEWTPEALRRRAEVHRRVFRAHGMEPLG